MGVFRFPELGSAEGQAIFSRFDDLTPEERAKWREAAKSTWDYFVQIGGPQAKEIIQIADETRKEIVDPSSQTWKWW